VIALAAAAALWSLPVELSEPHAPYARVRLPLAVDPSPSGDYRDLRVRDDHGREIPYAIDPDGTPSETLVAASALANERPADAPSAQRASLVLPADDQQIVGIRYATTTPVFARDVEVDCSADGETWAHLASERIWRYDGSPPQLAFEADWHCSRWYRVTIDDHDDAPLANARVTLLARAHEIVFPVARGRRYTLTWGDPALEPPSYDLRTVLDNEPWHAQRATPGRIVASATGKTFTSSPHSSLSGDHAGRTPAWLPGAAFGAAVVVLVLFALGLLRSGTAGEPRGS
jgi:hypothetical protein